MSAEITEMASDFKEKDVFGIKSITDMIKSFWGGK